MRVSPKRHLNWFSHFAYTAAKAPNAFIGADTPKIAPFLGTGAPFNSWFHRPMIRVIPPNGISIGSAVFAGLRERD